MGANVAPEIAAGQPTESTVGARTPELGQLWKSVFFTSKFLVQDVGDNVGVELCGALKNIVAIACGFVDGLGYGSNTKATMMRLGLVEMQHFCKIFYPTTRTRTFFESCGIADLIATCYGGRNRQVAEAMVKSGKTYMELEKEMLGGQKLQGPLTAEEVNHMLKERKLESR
jgi:glycerol-3-phosphate dehydrogenase (NAD+)